MAVVVVIVQSEEGSGVPAVYAMLLYALLAMNLGLYASVLE